MKNFQVFLNNCKFILKANLDKNFNNGIFKENNQKFYWKSQFPSVLILENQVIRNRERKKTYDKLVDQIKKEMEDEFNFLYRRETEFMNKNYPHYIYFVEKNYNYFALKHKFKLLENDTIQKKFFRIFFFLKGFLFYFTI